MKLFPTNRTEHSGNAMLQKLPDLLYILLLMYLSQKLLNDSLIGLVMGLMTVTWQYAAIYGLVRGGIYSQKSIKAIRIILSVVSTLIGSAALVLRERILNDKDSLVLIALSAIIMFKNILTVKHSGKMLRRRRRLTLLHALFFALFTAVCLLFMKEYAAIAIVSYIFIDSYNYTWNLKYPFMQERHEDNISDIASYRLFSYMSFFTSISFYLALFSYIGYIFAIPNGNINLYAALLLGVAFTGIVCFICYKLIQRIPLNTSMPLFILGAVIWIYAVYRLFYAKSFTAITTYSVLFGIGICFIYVALYRQNEHFRHVSCLIDRDITSDRLAQANEITQAFGFIISALIITVSILARTLLFSEPKQERVFSGILLLLPLIFIVISIILALMQPLDASALDKLDSLSQGKGENEMRIYLENILVKKYRKRYGVRIIAFFIKPFVYHKVYGKENVLDETLPAVFVCNHGEIYGPVTAVTHLPYYFRPWTHADMLNYGSAKERIYNGSLKPMNIPEFLKKPIACICARLATWALNSFDPVPVYLGNIREVFKTMQASVQVLAQGDSLLLFPENPQNEQDGRYASGGSGTFYTGFAQIGLEYYKKYQKCVTFYPVFASKQNRTFRIGKGVRFDKDNNRHDEKLRIASSLEKAMKELADQ